VPEVVGLRHQVEVAEAEDVAVLVDSVEQAERPLEPVVRVLAAVPEVDLLVPEEVPQLVVEVVQQQVGPLVQEVS
jgi:hypothetical protein